MSTDCQCGVTNVTDRHAHESGLVHRAWVGQQRRGIRYERMERIDAASPATLDLIDRILDGGEQATQDTIGALRDESLLFGDDEQPDVADRLRVLAGMP